ncbi:MAG TPA: class I SAM-dependent methyltransferase, partial [Solimonas sp.]|nr:class I SAM-dependent methyltransferase [Solimonas sp.]
MAAAPQPGWYERHLLPYLLDLACGIGPVRRQRQKVVPQARGRVLEIGIGTGLNLPHYDATRVDTIVGLDPGVEMHRLAQRRVAEAGLSVELVGLSAERIPFPDASFDCVLVTYSLCTIPDPVAALREMRRVLKPGAPLLYCEHGAAPDAGVRRWQSRLTPAWSRLAGGCHLDRDIPALLAQAGFVTDAPQAAYLPGP